MKRKELSGLTKKRVKSAIATALALVLTIPAAVAINNFSVSAEDELPSPVEVYNFNDSTGLNVDGAENNPTIVSDATRGNVLELKNDNSVAAIANPFAGRTSLVEYPAFTSAGTPFWEKGVTISYWQKTTDTDSSVFSFNLVRDTILQKDDKTKYLLFQRYQANPDDEMFSLGTPTQLTFPDGKYNGKTVSGVDKTKEYTVYLNLGMFARFNPAYTGDGYYLQQILNSRTGEIKSYTLVAMGTPISIDEYGTIMSSTSKLKYGTEKSGLQFNSSGSWGFLEGSSATQMYTNGVPVAVNGIGYLNRGNSAAAYAYTTGSGGAKAYLNASPIKSAGTWHYITLVVKNDSISTYIDGVLKDEALYSDRATVGTVDSNKAFNLGFGYYSLDTGIVKTNPTNIHENASSLATPENGSFYFSVYTDSNYPDLPVKDLSKLGYNGNTVSATLMEILTNPNATLQLGGTANCMDEIALNVGTSAGTCIDSMAFFTQPLTADQVTALYEKVQAQDLVGVDQPIETQAPTSSPSTSPSETPSNEPSETPSDIPSEIPSDIPSETPPVSQSPSPVTQTPVPGGKLGDVDGNGSVELADANIVLKAALNIISLTDEQKLLADADGNKSIELADANLVLKAALGIITL